MPHMVKVILMDANNIKEIASGMLDSEKVGGFTTLRWHGRDYMFRGVVSGQVIFNEVSSKPYVITRF